MDRLISERAVLGILNDYYRAWFLNDERFMDAVNAIKAIPSAEPYKGMTNGQVHDMLYQMLVELKDGQDRYGAERWWNSPYKGVAIPSTDIEQAYMKGREDGVNDFIKKSLIDE